MSVEILNDVRQTFGPVDSIANLAGHVATFGVKRQVVVPVRFDDLPSHLTGDVTGAQIPSNAIITSLVVTPANTAFAGGTSYSVELVDDEGNTEATLEAAITLAEMNSGLVATLADTTVGTGGPVYAQMTATGTFTAGEGALVIEYIPQINVL